jgi:hypothetical protein
MPTALVFLCLSWSLLKGFIGECRGISFSTPMSELSKFRNRIQSLKVLIEQSNLSDEWKQVARDAALSWVAGMSEKEWLDEAGVTAAEAEHLRSAAVWPWRKES